MARWRRDTGPEWPTRLQRFCEWEWSEAEITEAAEGFARRHAVASRLEEPLPPDSWPGHMTAAFAYTHFRMRWARENGRERDLVDQMRRNRLRRQRSNTLSLEES
jgi:hypothetical protein